MRIFILTAFQKGFPVLALQELLKNNDVCVAGVVFSREEKKNRVKFLQKKLLKIFKIGILGAINGIRIRSWYDDEKILAMPFSLRELCKKNNIQYFEISSTSLVNIETVNLIKSLNCDAGVSLGNNYISKKIFSIPKNEMYNIHHEILPEYKGAQPVIWQLFNGSKVTGFTIHKISSSIDEGEILFRKEMNIEFKETLAETVKHNFGKLLRESAAFLNFVLCNCYNIKPEKTQSSSGFYTTPTFSEFVQMQKNFSKLKEEISKGE